MIQIQMKDTTTTMNKQRRIPCRHCDGRGTEPTVLEYWSTVAGNLRSIRWPDERIAEIKGQIQDDEVLAVWPTREYLLLRNAKGELRKLYKCEPTDPSLMGN
jgi:hypothetical protein